MSVKKPLYSTSSWVIDFHMTMTLKYYLCYPDCTVCCYISADFVSGQELITAAFEVVFTANAKIFSTSHLVIVA